MLSWKNVTERVTEVQLQQTLSGLEARDVRAYNVYCSFSSMRNTEAESDWQHAAIFNITALQAALANSRRSELPTAIGLMPQSFLSSAHNEAPQKTGLTAGKSTVRQRSANSVSFTSSVLHLPLMHW
jgi:hypothetical protein